MHDRMLALREAVRHAQWRQLPDGRKWPMGTGAISPRSAAR
jgi:hypothetical protein